MSTAAEAQTTSTPATTTTSTPTPDGGGGGGGERRRQLRTMSYSEGADSLNPVQMREEPSADAGRTSGGTEAQRGTEGTGGTTTTADANAGTTNTGAAGTSAGTTTPTVNVPPHVPQPYQDPTRDPTFRQRTLQWANGQIGRIRELMSYGVFDWAVTDGEATQALQILQGMPTANRIVVAQELARTEAGGRLFENVPDGAKRTNASAFMTVAVVTGHTDYLRGVMRQQPQGVSASADAPLLFRMLPLITEADIRAAADAVRDPATKDRAPLMQWVNLGPEPSKGDLTRRFGTAVDQANRNHQAQAARAEQERQTTAASAEAMRTNPAFRQTVNTLQDLLSYGVFDWAITDGDARRVFGIFQRMGSRQEVAMAVNQLDRGPFMDRFLDNLPANERWGAGKRAFLRICAARSPEKNVRFVRQLLSYGVFDWAITDEEARLAFELVRLMPADVQRAFQDAQGGQWWQRMEGNLAQEQMNDRDANLYANEGEKGQRKAEFEQQCANWDRGQLQTTLEMLLRMGEDDFVETTLRQKGVLGRPANAWIGQVYGFLPDHRDQRVFGDWISNSARDRQDPGFFARVGGIASTLGHGIEYGVTGGSTFDLNAAQNALGGEINNPTVFGGGQSSHMVLAARQNETDNRISVNTNNDTGRQTLRGQQINIASLTSMNDGTSIQTGPIGIAGIDVDFKWPTQQDPGSSLRISIPAIMARDIALTTRDAMWTIGGLTITGLLIEARQPPGTAPQNADQAKSAMMGEVQRSVERLMGMIRGANTQPDQVAAQLTGAFSQLQATVTIGNITAERVGGSDGTYVERAEVRNAAITVSNERKGDTLRARLREIEGLAATRALTPEEQSEKQRLEAQRPLIEQLEGEERQLAALERARTIQPADQERLTQVRAELTIHRASVTVEDLSVRNVTSAGVHADDVHMGNFRASMTGSTRTGPGGATTRAAPVGPGGAAPSADNANAPVNTDARIEATVGEMSAHGVRQGDRQIGDVSASDVHASATTDAAGTHANLHVGALDVTNARGSAGADGSASANMSLRGFDVGVSGGANLLTAGANLDGQEIGIDLSLANLGLNGLNFQGSGMQIEAPSAALTGFRVGARVRVARTPEGGYTVVPVALSRLELDRLSATGLHVVLPVGGEQVDVRVPMASIVGLKVANVPLENFNPLSLSGNVSVQSIQTEMNASIGNYFQAHGKLSVSDLRADALETGAVNMHLGDLSLENLGFTADGNVPPTSIVAKLRGARAQITRLGGISGDVNVDRVKGAIQFSAAVGDFNMASVAYAGGGMNLSVTGGVTMTGAAITGSAELDPAALTGGATTPGVSPLKSLKISEFRIAKIQGKGIHYANPSAAQKVDLDRGYLEDIRVKNMDALAGTGNFHLGAAGVENLNLAVTQGLSATGGQRVIKANASARISGVDVSRANNGRMTFSVAGVAGNASGSMNETNKKGETTTSVSGRADASVSGISGTVGADGGVAAKADKARIGAHVEGTSGGNQFNVDANASVAGLSGSRGANGDVHANLGSGSANVSGTVSGAKGSGRFNLDLSNLGAGVDITSTGFAANVTVGSIGLSNTSFVAGDKAVKLGRGGRLNGLVVRVAATTDAQGSISGVKINEISASRLQMEDATVQWGQYALTLPHGHIDGISVTGLNLVSSKNGLVPTGGHIGVQQIAVDRLQANVGNDLSAHAGNFTANGMSIDLLGNDNVAFKLADVQAHAVGAMGPNGTVELAWLNAHGISMEGGAAGGDVRVAGADFGVGAAGASNGGTIGPSKGTAATGIHKRYSMPFLDKLGGQVGVEVPIAGDRISGALIVANGRAKLGPTLASIHLPHEQYWGWAPKWLVARMVTEAAGYIVDYFNPEFAKLRPKIENSLASDGGATAGSAGFELNAQAISTGLVEKMGGFSALLDVASPTGPGIMRTAGDAVATWLTEHDPLNLYGSDEAARASAQQMREAAKARRAQELVDWIRQIALDIAVSANGQVEGFQTPPKGGEKKWLTCNATTDFSARGTLAQQIKLGLHAGVTGLNLDLGNLQVAADSMSLDANAGAGLSSGGTARGSAGVTGSATGITLRMRR